MNSISKNDCEPCRKKERHEESRKENQCKTIVNCSCPRSTMLTAPTTADPAGATTLSSLTLDTSCLCNPKVKIDFASNVVELAEFTGSVRVQIFKQCKHQLTAVPIGPSWNYRFTRVASRTFSFFVCDSDSCKGECCTYTAVATVTSTTATENNPMVPGTISINNATLAATVTCEENSCNKKCNY